MGHRDELEAAHGRIQALERALEEARAERARPPGPSPKMGKPRAPARREARPELRPRPLRRSVAWLSGAVYGALALALVVLAPTDLAARELALVLTAVLVVAIGCGILARIHRAPSPFDAALVTLLVSTLALGAMALGGFALANEAPEGAARVAVRTVAMLAAAALGTAIAAAWVPEAAASTGSDD